MNYEKTVCEMLEHADNHRSPENFKILLSALSLGISQLSINVGTMDAQEILLDNIFSAIRAEARATLMGANGMSGDEFRNNAPPPRPLNG